MSLRLREVEVFKPYANETPEELLWAENMLEEEVAIWLSAEMLRIAKLGNEVLGVYAMDRGDGTTYELRGVIVARGWRRQGLGRWLVGHALGVAESKGARHILFPSDRARRFFTRIGFCSQAQGQRFDLIPE